MELINDLMRNNEITTKYAAMNTIPIWRFALHGLSEKFQMQVYQLFRNFQ